jgi:hypothetical protein
LTTKELALLYCKYHNNEKITNNELFNILWEINKSSSSAALYEKLYREQLIANHTLQQENEFLIRELEKYEL